MHILYMHVGDSYDATHFLYMRLHVDAIEV